MISCGSSTQTEKTEDNSSSSKTSTPDLSKIGRNNYAVIWNWTTEDKKLVEDNSSQISQELTALWEDDIIENAYYDSDAKIDKLGNFPNISFFLKAHSKKEARAILDDLRVVKKSIAEYNIHEVGTLWLDIKKNPLKKELTAQSYVAVWETNTPVDKSKVGKLLKSQNEAVLKLWNEGVIENVYFDIEGTHSISSKTDFVFFVNANSKEEAQAICNSLPFYQEKIANYHIHQAGLFWMGRSNSQ